MAKTENTKGLSIHTYTTWEFRGIKRPWGKLLGDKFRHSPHQADFPETGVHISFSVEDPTIRCSWYQAVVITIAHIPVDSPSLPHLLFPQSSFPGLSFPIKPQHKSFASGLAFWGSQVKTQLFSGPISRNLCKR